jgi:hypothetical protein
MDLRMNHKNDFPSPAGSSKIFSFKEYGFYLLLILLAGLAAFIMLYDMAWGPWAYSDSAAYISAARSLVTGHGLSVPTPEGGYSPLQLHQPLYPLLMSFFLLLDIHPFTTTTVLNTACFGLSILILGLGSYYFSKSKVYSLLVVAVMLCCPHIIENYDGAMSEPLYLFLTLVTFFLVLLFVEQPRAWLLILATVTAALSILTRYIGLVNLLAGALIIVCFPRERLSTRIRKAALFSAISALPPAIWLFLSAQPGTAGSRQIILPHNIFKTITDFWDGLLIPLAGWLPLNAAWQINDETRFLIVILLGILLAGSLGLAVWLRCIKKKICTERFDRLIFGAALLNLLYLLVFFGSFAFSSIPPDINSRTLIPLLPFFALILYGIFFHYPRSHLEKALAGGLILALFGLSFAVWYPYSRELLYDRHHNGLGYTSKYYQESTVLKAARQLPQDIPWIANEPAFFLLYLNKFPYDLSTITPTLIQAHLQPLGSNQTELDFVFREEEAAFLVLQPQLENELRKLIGDRAAGQIEKLTRGLDLYDQSFDGMIYFFDPNGN